VVLISTKNENLDVDYAVESVRS